MNVVSISYLSLMNCLSLYGYVLRHRADDVDEPIPDSSARKELPEDLIVRLA